MECRLSAPAQALETALVPVLYYLLAHGQA